ncbi:hypothetical protein FRB98_007791 [Tulasnella sp. 332]|nr:hypothetical protein FRB98_007791 [Tulasnella sp. 332]
MGRRDNVYTNLKTLHRDTDLVYPTAFRDPNADELSRLRKRIAELEHTVRVLTQRGSPEGGLDPGIMQAITGRVMSPAEGDESTRKKGRRDPPAGADARIQSSSSNHSGGPNAASNPSSFSTGTGIRIPGADSSAQASYTFTSPRGSPGSAVPMTTGSSVSSSRPKCNAEYIVSATAVCRYFRASVIFLLPSGSRWVTQSIVWLTSTRAPPPYVFARTTALHLRSRKSFATNSSIPIYKLALQHTLTITFSTSSPLIISSAVLFVLPYSHVFGIIKSRPISRVPDSGTVSQPNAAPVFDHGLASCTNISNCPIFWLHLTVYLELYDS